MSDYIYQNGEDGNFFNNAAEAEQDAIHNGWSCLQAAIVGGWTIAHESDRVNYCKDCGSTNIEGLSGDIHVWDADLQSWAESECSTEFNCGDCQGHNVEVNCHIFD